MALTEASIQKIKPAKYEIIGAYEKVILVACPNIIDAAVKRENTTVHF